MGEAPRLLLLHGFLSTSANWGPLRAALGSEAVCIAPDLPGYGLSPAPQGEYTLDAVVDALRPIIEREKPDYLLGHSMGSIVALALAGAMPGAFKRVGVAGFPLFRDYADACNIVRRNRGLFVSTFLQHPEAAHVACLILNRTRPIWLPAARRMRPGEPDSVLAPKFHHRRAGHIGAQAGIVFCGRAEQLAREAPVPVIALHGDCDRTASLHRARLIAAASGWDLQVVPGANHEVVVEKPEVAARWIRERLFAPVTGSVDTAAG